MVIVVKCWSVADKSLSVEMFSEHHKEDSDLSGWQSPLADS